MMYATRKEVLQAMGCTASMAERWSDIRNPVGNVTIKAEDDNTAELLLYDFIGFDWWSDSGTSAKTFAQGIAALGKIDKLNVRINSPGGDVFDGFAMFNILSTLEYPVEVTIDALAASAASIIAMAGDTIKAHETSQIMIHDAWMSLVGNEQDMVEAATVLGKLDDQISKVYAARGTKTPKAFRKLMDDESYLTPAEAKELGLIDEIIKTKKKTQNQSTAPALNRAKAWLAIERKRLGK